MNHFNRGIDPKKSIGIGLDHILIDKIVQFQNKFYTIRKKVKSSKN